MTDIEEYINKARRHAEDPEEPDHEVGDLQDALRGAWKIMTPNQRVALMASDPVRGLDAMFW